MSKPWFVYIVRCKDGTLYTGVTTDLERRVKEHNTSKKGAKYTRQRRPVQLVYHEEYPDRSEASKREYWIKKKMSKEEKEALIKTKR
jgi:putative endonuclease